MSTDSQIRAKINQINQLEGRIDSARAQYNSALGRKRQYERRLREVRGVKSNLERSFDGVVGAARRKQESAKSRIERATDGLSHEGALTAAIQRDLEKETEQDRYGSQMHASLQAEINRCQGEINSAQASMNSSQGTIDACRSQRSSLVTQAQQLSKRDDATIKVRIGKGY